MNECRSIHLSTVDLLKATPLKKRGFLPPVIYPLSIAPHVKVGRMGEDWEMGGGSVWSWRESVCVGG